MSKILLPTPQRGKDRKNTIGLSTLFIIKMADEYLKEGARNPEEASNLYKFAQFFATGMKEKSQEVVKKVKDGTWNIHFAQADVYKLQGGKAGIAAGESL